MQNATSLPCLLRIVCGLIVCVGGLLSIVTGTAYVKQFGQRIRALREARGMSQEDLADAAKLHRTHISLIERGRRSARLETIEQLCRAMHVQPARLMPRVDIKPR